VTRRRVAALGAAGVAVAVVIGLLLTPSGSGSRSGRAATGQVAPLFQTFDLDGHPVALSSFRGHRLVLNFWASWCQPCRQEFPLLRQLKAAHPDVVVLGVVFQDGDSPARAFLKAQRATWPGLRDPNAQIADAYGVHAKPGIPISVLVGPDGTIRGRQVGPLPDAAGVEAFIGQAPVH
jgi:cytochrome c biogenesis protein CcmG/thiol:disulfide interchange protein DsbE